MAMCLDNHVDEEVCALGGWVDGRMGRWANGWISGTQLVVV